MSVVFKLGLFAALDAAAVGAATAVVAIMAGWPIVLLAAATAAAVMAVKLVEFAVVALVFEVRGRAYDRAVARFYAAVASRDLKQSKVQLAIVERAVAPLYGIMSHILGWNAVDHDRLTSKRMAMLDSSRVVRDHFNSVSHRDWR